MSNLPREGNSSGSRFHSPDSPATASVPQSGAPRKQKNESPPVPDSTTEPAPMQVQEFQDGDDVFVRTDNGQQVLGTVGQIYGQTCQILFGDGTQQWAPFKRIKKMSTFLEEEKNKSQGHSKAAKRASTKAEAVPPPTVERPPSAEVPCASCGTTRKLSAKKAKLFEEGSKDLFQCRRCKNKSPVALSIGNLDTSRANSMGQYMLSTPGLHAKLPPDISIIPMGKPSSFSLPSTSAGPSSSQGFSRTPASDGTITKIPRQIQFSVVPSTTPSASCFNCGKPVRPYDSVHCNLCHSSCHLLCLALSPPPLNGDKFWDLLCTPCGNQKTSETTKVFSVRRNINSWSDIASLLIACLTAVTNGQKMFELETEIMPFLEGNMQRLHLPRQYKLPTLEVQQRHLLNAITTSRMRFVNGIEQGQKASFWGLRTDSPLVMSYPQDKKNLIQSIALGMGLKPSAMKINNTKIGPPQPTPAALGSASQAKSFADCADAQLSKQKTVAEMKKSETSFTKAEPTSSAGLKLNYQETGKSTAKNKNIPEQSRKSLNPAVNRYLSVKTKGDKETSPSKKALNAKAKKSSKMPENETNFSKHSIDNKPTVKPIPELGEESGRGRKRTLSKSMGSPTRKKRAMPEESPDHNRDSKMSVRIPMPKKLKLVKDGGDREGKPQFRVAIKSPDPPSPRKSKPITSDESSASSELSAEDDTDNEGPRAIKSAGVIPLPAPQIQNELKSSPAKVSPTFGSPRTGKPGRPKNSSLTQKPKPEKSSPLISRLRTRGRGRPLGSKTQVKPNKSRLNQNNKNNINLKLTVRPSGITVSKSTNNNGGPPVVSRRVGAFNSLRERRPSQLLPQNTEPSTNPISVISSSLLDAAIFGDYRMECLPRSPETEAERKTEALKVFAHFRAERENEVAALLLSRSETETRCQTRRKAELFVGRQKRDLNDFDSYEVIAKRVDADGLTRYQVLWKGHGVDWDEDEEDEEMVCEATVSPLFSSQGQGPGPKLLVISPTKQNIQEVEKVPVRVPTEPKSRPGKRKSPVNPLLFIDLTEDSA